MTQVTLHLSTDMYDETMSVAEEQNTNKTDIIRRALALYFHAYKGAKDDYWLSMAEKIDRNNQDSDWKVAYRIFML